MKDAYYFSHDCGARNDPKILQLRLAMGWEGFGIYFAVIEILREQRGYKFPSLAKASLCLTLSIEKTTLEKFFGLALDLGLLVDDGDSIYSESLLRRMEKKEELKKKLSEAGRKGGLAKASLKPPPTIKGKERKGKERKRKERKEFTAPTLVEVKSYFSENGYLESAGENAFHYYSENDWHDVHGNEVKNWKMKMRGVWFKDENIDKTPNKNEVVW